MTPDMPLREAVLRLRGTKRRHGLSVKGMIVLDENKNIVGMLSIKDIMRAVIPFYLSADLSAFSWENMLEQMTYKCRGKKVGDVMIAKVITISAEASLMACVDIMIKKGLQRLPVVNENKKLIGMIYIRDLYDLIANILTAEEVH